ncbi:MAG: ATP-binding protein [Prevotellaceae bacterium]|jgi:predicted AAA+ superfamily ATPase|nr:ATP-binding protein [Prevotellaceae bacterium]
MVQREQQLERLRNLQDTRLIKVITGIRRAGKSTLFKQFQQELLASGVDERNIISLNFEDMQNEPLTERHVLHDYIMMRVDKNVKNYVFFDEIQNVNEFERLVDSLFVKDYIDLYITGSNAYFLSSDLATLLTGRYLEIQVSPFSFKEYLSGYANKSFEKGRMEIFDDFMTFGGLPETLNLLNGGQGSEIMNYIGMVFSTIVETDIMKRNKIKLKTDFELVTRFLFDSAGKIVSPNNIAAYMRSAGNKIDNETVKNYLDILCDAFLFHKVQRYDIKGKKLLQTLNKYYAADIGFVSALLGKSAKIDRGRLLENIVFIELQRRYTEIYVGKNAETEVDFLVKDTHKNITYFQVSLTVRDAATLQRELRPLETIRDHNPKYLLTLDPEEPVHKGIIQRNAIKWLLEKM